jgi:hypothetical protein
MLLKMEKDVNACLRDLQGDAVVVLCRKSHGEEI